MPRILHIIPTLVRGGAEKQMCLLAEGLKAAGHDVHVACLTAGGPLEERLKAANVPLTIIGKSWKIDPWAYGRLKKHIVELKPDLVHTWIFAANSYGRAAAFAAKVPVVIAGERCVDPWKRWHELAIDRYLAKRTTTIATNSSGVVDFYAGHGIDRSKFTVIPNGIAPFAPRERVLRGELLRELGLPPNAKLVGTVGRLWPQKNMKDLIWAIDLVRCLRDDAHLLIIGDGPQRWRLERFRAQTHTENFVHFLGERDDVARLLPHFDVFCLASSYEGQSNAIMEAMSAGIPVVASDIPGNRDLVVPEVTGEIVGVGDRAGFAKAIRTFLDEPNRARQYGQAGQARMLEEFSIEKMVARHIELYERLLAKT